MLTITNIRAPNVSHPCLISFFPTFLAILAVRSIALASQSEIERAPCQPDRQNKLFRDRPPAERAHDRCFLVRALEEGEIRT